MSALKERSAQRCYQGRVSDAVHPTTTRWSITVEVLRGRASEPPTVARVSTYLVELVTGASGALITLDGRAVSHRELGGALSFSVRGREVRLALRDAGWELTLEGNVVPPLPRTVSDAPEPWAGRTDPPPAMAAPELRLPARPWLVLFALGALISLLSITRGVFYARPALWVFDWHEQRASDGSISVRLPGQVERWRLEAEGGALEVLSAVPQDAGFFGVAVRPAGGAPSLMGTPTPACEQAVRAFVGALRGRVDVWLDMDIRSRGPAPDGAGCELSGKLDRSPAPFDVLHKDDLWAGHVAFRARVIQLGAREYIALAIVAPQFAAYPDVTGFGDSVKLAP